MDTRQIINMLILGIDPGIAIVGWGLVEVSGRTLRCVDYGTIKTSKESLKDERLKTIGFSLNLLLEKMKPDVIAVEQLFFAKNRKTAITVAEARGVILATSSGWGELTEITPLQVKQFIAFSGRADKLKVGQMVQKILKLKEMPRPDDAADALAIASCVAFYRNKIRL